MESDQSKDGPQFGTTRKGARSMSEIAPALLDSLSNCKFETASLVEWLAIDHAIVVENVLRPGLEQWLEPLASGDFSNRLRSFVQEIKAAVSDHSSVTSIQATRLIGTKLVEQFARPGEQTLIMPKIREHRSDVIRGYAAFVIANQKEMSIRGKLYLMRPLAADSHFNVRELGWMALREEISSNLDDVIAIFVDWVYDTDPNIRRFAIEATRPRGVWCKHITKLRDKPERCLKLLDPLFADSSRYVQDSVANWLHDAWKDHPDFVRKLCEEWSKRDGANDHTNYIIKKALRSN